MRFAGPQIYFDPRDLPYGAAERFAGALPISRPDLVERITSAILPVDSSAPNSEPASE